MADKSSEFTLGAGAETIRKQKSRSPNPAVKRLIDLYYAEFVRRWNGGPDNADVREHLAAAVAHKPSPVLRRNPNFMVPIIYGGKDAKHIEKLLATWGEPSVEWLIKEFLWTTDPRAFRSDHTISELARCAQHLLLRKNGHSGDQRTAENVDAATRAMQRR